MSLPRFLVLKSPVNSKCLRYIREDGKTHGFLQFSGEEVVSPYAKYEVVLAKTAKGLVHIRSCYNNKYWVRSSQNDRWIVAAADEPEENQSIWSCTLFEPVHVDGDASRVRFRHVQLQSYACAMRVAAPFYLCLSASCPSPNQELYDVGTIIDWESLLILPKRIAFKGDNGKYLAARSIEGHPYLQFESSNVQDGTVGNQVFTMSDGSVRIKSDYHGKFWRRSPNWIWADSNDDTSNNSDTLFWPVKVDKVKNNVVALRNLGNNNFCSRHTSEGKTNCLNAATATITTAARLEVEELVISRTVYNVNFRRADARIYGKRVITMATGKAINPTPQTKTMEVKLPYTETKTSTWNASVSLKLGVKTSITTGIPSIADGKIEISAEFTGSYQWGETRTSTTTVQKVYKDSVPPMTIMTVTLLASQGSSDVPFSYSQRDTLTDGQNVIYDMDDGVYTGINCYDFKYETKQEPVT